MNSRHIEKKEDAYFRVLQMLEANPDMTQREIAKSLGFSTGALNYCLKALIEKGFVKVQNFNNSKNKFGYVYVLTPMGISEKLTLTSSFLRRKILEYEALKTEIENLKAKSVANGGAFEVTLSNATFNIADRNDYKPHDYSN